MKRKNGFTLIEMLVCVVILAVVFMLATPKMLNAIKEGENKNIEIIKENVLNAAKEYINEYNTHFLDDFKEAGHTEIINIDVLVDSGLVDDDVYLIEGIYGVKIELLDNNKLEYTIIIN